MEAAGSYIVSVSAAAIFCGIIKSILPLNSGGSAIVRLVSGIFLVFVAIRPLTQVNLGELPVLSPDYISEAEAASAEGEILAYDTMADIIKSRSEAYILDKAHALQAELTVTVSLSNDHPPVPATVQLSGSVSPYAKSRLERILQEELGISKENQIWID